MPFTLEQINQAQRNIIMTEIEKSYLISYREMLAYFSSFDVVTVHTFITGVHMVYGWMPTMLKLFSSNDGYKSTVDILNSVKHGGDINEDKLVSLTSVINHSLVGSSKLLHCLNPNKYAIWDSRVYKFIYQKKSQTQL